MAAYERAADRKLTQVELEVIEPMNRLRHLWLTASLARTRDDLFDQAESAEALKGRIRYFVEHANA